eukprot:12366222-Ditylum_brightwellii.AAC.1
MKQREDEKAAREQQLLLACMEREVSECSCKEYESQRERRHQDFMMMMMMMMMVTCSKSSSSSISTPSPPSSLSVSPSTSPSNFVTPSKRGDESKNDDDYSIECAIARETVLHDTVMQMHTPTSPSTSMSESDKAQINKIREVKT